jgi:ureidoglycolate lyase
MKIVSVESLTATAFQPFGSFCSMLAASDEKLGAPPLEFFRDMLPQSLGQATAVSYSICRVEERPLVIDATECHSHTAEMMMPLDADVLMHFGPATTPADGPPLDRIRVFLVPKGTMVLLKPGTWHHGRFVLDGAPANALVALPERTYANDCTVVTLADGDPIRIER